MPPDTGTFFFHPHCNTAEQLGRGLAGVLIVEGDETRALRRRRVLVLRDWRDRRRRRRFLPFLTEEAAGKAGTFGTIRSCQRRDRIRRSPCRPAATAGCASSTSTARASWRSASRARSAAIVAIDGMRGRAVAAEGVVARPGDAPRRRRCAAPADGETVRRSYDYFAPEPVPLARLTGEGDARRTRRLRSGAASRRTASPSRTSTARSAWPSPSPPPPRRRARRGGRPRTPAVFLDDRSARRRNLLGDQQARLAGGAITAALPPPLATLAARQELRLRAAATLTPHMHPIHIHGHSFQVAEVEQARSAGPSCRHGAAAAEGAGRGGVRGGQSRRLDAPLPHHRASGDRHDGLYPGRMKAFAAASSSSPPPPPPPARSPRASSTRCSARRCSSATGCRRRPRPMRPTGSGRCSARAAAPAATPARRSPPASLRHRTGRSPGAASSSASAMPKAIPIRSTATSCRTRRCRACSRRGASCSHPHGRAKARYDVSRRRSIAAPLDPATQQSIARWRRRFAAARCSSASIAEAVLALADPEDRDGDGISGRARMIDARRRCRRSAATAGRPATPVSTSRSPTPSRASSAFPARAGRFRMATARSASPIASPPRPARARCSRGHENSEEMIGIVAAFVDEPARRRRA